MTDFWLDNMPLEAAIARDRVRALIDQSADRAHRQREAEFESARRSVGQRTRLDHFHRRFLRRF